MPETAAPSNDEGGSEVVRGPIMMVLDDPAVVYVSKPDFSGWEKVAVDQSSRIDNA